MKQKIYILGIVTLLLIFTSMLFKINHLAGAGYLIVAGISMFLLVFLPLALVNNYRYEGNRTNGFLYLITWFTCLVVFGSMLFKIMHWPGAGKLLLIAIPFPFVVFLPVYLSITSKIKNYNIYNTVLVLYFLVYLAVFSSLLSLNVSLMRVDQSLVLADTYRKMTAFVKSKPVVLHGLQNGNYESRIVESSDQVLATLDLCKELLYKNIDATGEEVQKTGGKTAMMDSRSFAAGILLAGKEQSPAAQLEKDIRHFVLVLKDSPAGDSLAILADHVLMMDGGNTTEQSWGNMMFDNIWLSWALIILESMETNVNLLRQSALRNAG
jgi:hypothetical protein